MDMFNFLAEKRLMLPLILILLLFTVKEEEPDWHSWYSGLKSQLSKVLEDERLDSINKMFGGYSWKRKIKLGDNGAMSVSNRWYVSKSWWKKYGFPIGGIIVSIIMIIFLPQLSFIGMAGATITSDQTGNSDATATWVGGSVPAAGDDVVIAAGHTVTTSADWTVDNVTVNSTGILYIVTYDMIIGTSIASGTLANAGTVRMGDLGELKGLNSSYACNVNGAGTYDWDYGGSATDITLADLDITVTFTTGGAGVTITVSGDIDFRGNLTITNGDSLLPDASVDLYFTTNAGLVVNINGTLGNTSWTSNIYLQGPSGNSYFKGAGTLTVGTGHTVNIDGTTGWILEDGFTYYNIIKSAGVLCQIADGITIEHSLSVTSGYFRFGAGTFNIGTSIASGTMTVSSGAYIELYYTGITIQGVSSSYPAQLSGAGTWNWGRAGSGSTQTFKDVTFDLAFTSGGAGFTINLTGDVEFKGNATSSSGDTWTHNDNDIYISGTTATQTINDISGSTLYLTGDQQVNIDAGCVFSTINLGDDANLHYTEDTTETSVAYVKTTGGTGGTVTIDTGVDLTSDTCSLNASPVANNTPGNTNWIDTISGTGTWTVTPGSGSGWTHSFLTVANAGISTIYGHAIADIDSSFGGF